MRWYCRGRFYETLENGLLFWYQKYTQPLNIDTKIWLTKSVGQQRKAMIIGGRMVLSKTRQKSIEYFDIKVDKSCIAPCTTGARFLCAGGSVQHSKLRCNFRIRQYRMHVVNLNILVLFSTSDLSSRMTSMLSIVNNYTARICPLGNKY